MRTLLTCLLLPLSSCLLAADGNHPTLSLTYPEEFMLEDSSVPRSENNLSCAGFLSLQLLLCLLIVLAHPLSLPFRQTLVVPETNVTANNVLIYSANGLTLLTYALAGALFGKLKQGV